MSLTRGTVYSPSEFRPVRSIWICVDRKEGGEDSVEELSLCWRSQFRKKAAGSGIDLMKAVTVQIRAREGRKNTGNTLTGMLGTLFAQTPASEKKRLLAENYAMEMTANWKGESRLCAIYLKISELKE